MSQAFRNKAMLVALHLESWSATRKDKQATESVHQTFGTSGKAGRYSKALVRKEALSGITRADSALRDFHRENTLPWSQDGMRILPSANHPHYAQDMRRLLADRDKAVREFCAAYPSHVAQAQADLNGLFDYKDYPKPVELPDFFKASCDFLPFPDADDFRVSLVNEDLEAIRKHTAESIREAEREAMRDLWTRLHDAVKHMADKLSETRDGGKAPIFRDSLVQNVKDLCALLPRLNVTDSPELEQARRDVLAKLGNVDPQTLRDSANARAQVTADANGILSKLSAYTGGAPALPSGSAASPTIAHASSPSLPHHPAARASVIALPA